MTAARSMPWPHFTPRKDLVLILQEARWAPGLVWTGGESQPYRDLIPDRPARIQLLYRLRYPAHCKKGGTHNTVLVTLQCNSMPVDLEGQ